MSKNYNIAIIRSRFNEVVTDKLLSGALEKLRHEGITLNDEHIFNVPGAVEIPLIAKRLAGSKQYDAILCLGAVIRGETSHYDYVCQQVSYGCQRIALDYDIPVIFGILTTENIEQALARCGGAKGHKGKDCADAAIEMCKMSGRIKGSLQPNDNKLSA